MAISNKTRKILWGRAGNRCATCKHVLVVNSTAKNDESVIGEECHIVSGQTDGPRYDPTFPEERLDSYENLMLLCRIHHKMIDDQAETYTANILRQMKSNHENWVEENLNPSPKLSPIRIMRTKEKIPAFLNRLTTGKEALNIVDGCCASSMDHDELETQEEVDLIGAFLENLRDCGDLGPDFDPSDHVRIGFGLTQILRELEDAGFYVFGAREIQRIEGGEYGPSAWPVAIIRVLRKTNPEIVTVPIKGDLK